MDTRYQTTDSGRHTKLKKDKYRESHTRHIIAKLLKPKGQPIPRPKNLKVLKKKEMLPSKEKTQNLQMISP